MKLLILSLLVTVGITSALDFTAGPVAIAITDDILVEVVSDVSQSGHVLRGHVGKTLTTAPSVGDARQDDQGDSLSLTWEGQASLSVTQREDIQGREVTCQDVSWVAPDCRTTIFEDCYSLEGAHWYGGAPVKRFQWPVEKWDEPMKPFVTGDSLAGGYGGVQERYWFSSAGQAIYVDWEVPLWVSINSLNDGQICLRATYEDSPYMNYDKSPLTLNYTLCQGSDVMETHRYFMDTELGRPSDIPDELLFRFPIYSTWARYKKDINQSLVIDFAQEILDNGFENAQMEIDDKWETSYGRLEFDTDKFPDPKAMTDQLTAMGFRTTLWVHPFTAMASEYVWWGSLLSNYVSDPGRHLPAMTSWWNGVATILDFSDADANEWWFYRCLNLREEFGISSFKFDAGEANWLPSAYAPGTPWRNPSDYTTYYVNTAYNLDSVVRHQEVRVGARTQDVPIFVRLLDKTSDWSYDNGLKSVIPHVLLFSLIGYPFALPDMIGGNAYGNTFPDRELFIRWIQVNVFLPGFQFSIVPWQYDQEVVDISRQMLSLHEQYADLIIDLARNATVTGDPIIRPLWWAAPSDPVALELDSEFLLGDNLLVAPVLDQGALARDVYLTAGRWRDVLRGGELQGGQWYSDYPAALDQLPYFTRIQ